MVGLAADLEHWVQARVAIDVEDDTSLLVLLEPTLIHLDPIGTNGQKADDVFACRIGGAATDEIGIDVDGGDGDVGDCGAARVGDSSRY